MCLYEVPLSMSLLCFGIGGYVSQLPYVWYYVGVKSSFNMLMRNASPRGPMCFICQDRVSCYFYFAVLPLGPEL